MLLRSAQNPNKLSMVEHYYDQRYGCKVLKVTFPIMQSVPFHILCMKLLFYCRRQHLNITTGQDGASLNDFIYCCSSICNNALYFRVNHHFLFKILFYKVTSSHSYQISDTVEMFASESWRSRSRKKI